MSTVRNHESSALTRFFASPVRPERLWDQYEGKVRAELMRGSGWWPAQAETVALEPPFVPFDPRSLTSWDCLFNGWEAPYEASFLKRLFNATSIVHSLGQPLLVPPAPFLEGGDLVVVSVEQFHPDDETTLPVGEQFLRSLLAVQHPVSFELIGLGERPVFDHQKAAQLVLAGKKVSGAITGWTEPTTAIQFVARQSDAAIVEQQLATHYPASTVVAGAVNPLDLDVRLRYEPAAIACTLALEAPYVYPIRTFRQLSPDVLAIAIGAMEMLNREEFALLQILFEPAREPWAENVMSALADPYKPDTYCLPPDEMRLVKEKFGSPLFAASVRLYASRLDVFRQLVGWSQQFSNAPHQRWVMNESDWENGAPGIFEREWLEITAQYRCSYRPGVLLGSEELAGLVHLPGQRISSERLTRAKSRTRAAKTTRMEGGSMLLGENVHRGKTKPARISADIRPLHAYIAGATGTGKSTLLLNMILQDIEAGAGVGVLDPHGDLIADILPRIPQHRVADVVLFNPADQEHPPALNILHARDHRERERLVSETVTTFHRFFSDAWGPRLQHILAHSLDTVMRLKGGTLRELRRLLTDPIFRARVVSKLTDPLLVSFWNDEFPQLPKGSLDPILNKLSPFMMSQTVRNIVCQPEALFDFDTILNGRKVLLASLSFGLLTESIAGTLGNFLVNKLLAATFRRAAIPKERRQPFYLYLDEFQHFLNVSAGFDKVLAEARKYAVTVCMANQYVAQLSSQMRAAIFGNVGTLLAFRLGNEDARLFAHDLHGFAAEDLLHLSRGEVIARVGNSTNVFNLKTAPPPPPPEDGPDRHRAIVANCRKRYARPRRDVEAKFTSSAPQKPPKQQPPPSSETPPREVTPDDLSDFVT